jgi:hypothetical protein
VPVLEKPHPEEERIVILILPEYESHPRLRQLKQLDDWLRRCTRRQMSCICLLPTLLLGALAIWSTIAALR